MRVHRTRFTTPLAVLVLLLLLVPSLPLPARGASAQDQPDVAGEQPNIILIVTDDLDSRSLELMPNVSALLREQGTSFSNFLVTTPLCCPSRASILRGQYVHNHGVLTNTGLNGGFPTFHRLNNEESTVATWLQDAGYRTAMIGKYLNGYPSGVGRRYVPTGWDDWYGVTTRPPAYYNYELNENGRQVSHGQRPKDYLTDVLTRKAVDFVHGSTEADQPFFIYFAPYAPHGPATAPPRHAEAFADARAPRPPSFDEVDVSDKPEWVQGLAELTDRQIEEIDERYRERLQSLLALDDAVGTLVETLRDTGELDRTYIALTSDNGFHLGEHRLPHGKQSPYEESIRVPLLLRGPGVPAGRVEDRIALNVDLAPTVADLAGATIPDFVDGRSLLPLLTEEVDETSPWRQASLVELFDPVKLNGGGALSAARRAEARKAAARRAPAGQEIDGQLDGELDPGTGDRHSVVPPYLALRTNDYLYVEYDTGERELYDLRTDPYQLENLVSSADDTLLDRLASRLAELKDCAAAECRDAEDAALDLPAAE